MADRCVFCGKQLSLFSRREVLCCGVLQPTCADCHPTISALDQEERGRRAWYSGRAVEPEKIQAFLEERKAYLEEQKVKQEAAYQASISDVTCIHCGIPLRKMGKKLFQLGVGDWGHVMSGGLYLELQRCPSCGKVEFFIPNGTIPPEEGEEEMVTCPVCGSEHHPGVGCPRCAMNQVSGGHVRKADWKAAQEKSKGSSDPKPPWEK